MKKQEAITQVKDCISSIFSGEDVIKLIEQITLFEHLQELFDRTKRQH